MPSDLKPYRGKFNVTWAPGTDLIADWEQLPSHSMMDWTQTRFIMWSDEVGITDMAMIQAACVVIEPDTTEQSSAIDGISGSEADELYLDDMLDKYVHKTAGSYVTNTALTASDTVRYLGDADTSLMFQPGQLHKGTYAYLEDQAPILEVRHMVLGFMANKGFRAHTSGKQRMHTDFEINSHTYSARQNSIMLWVMTNPATVPDNQFEFGSTVQGWTDLRKLLAPRRNKITGELEHASDLVGQKFLTSIYKAGDAAADNDALEILLQPEMNIAAFRQSYFIREVDDGPAVVSALG